MSMDGPVVLRVLGSTMEGLFDVPEYLVDYDVDAMDGFGTATLCPDVDKAMTFPDFASAMTAWKTRSTVQPTRFHDGKPNRPLTAYTVEVVALAKAKAEDAAR